MNWVFRESGILARICEDNAGKYEDVTASLPADIQKKIAAFCSYGRFIDPNACSDAYMKGLIYTLDSNIHKKCRNDEMFFPLTPETAEYMAVLVCVEVAVRKSIS